MQYHAPVYRRLQERYGVPVTVIYGSDFSVAGYDDREFRTAVAWDVDLLSGYRSVFLSRVADGGGRSFDQLSARGLGRALTMACRGPIMLVGYTGFHRTAFIQAWRSRRPLLLRAETADHAVGADGQVDDSERVDALNGAGWLATDQGDRATAVALLDESVERARALDDRVRETPENRSIGRDLFQHMFTDHDGGSVLT